MYILIGLVLLLVIGVILATDPFYKKYEIDTESFGIVLTIMSFIFVAIMLLILWGNNSNIQNHIQAKNLERETYIEALNNPKFEAERVSYLPKIIEFNEDIRSNVYWNNTQWNWWIPDELTKIKPIEIK